MRPTDRSSELWPRLVSPSFREGGVVHSPQRLYLLPLTVMWGRKLDGEAKHNAQHAASSALRRGHGMCMSGFDHFHSNFLLCNDFIIFSYCLFAATLDVLGHFKKKYRPRPPPQPPPHTHTLSMLPFLPGLVWFWVGDWTSSCGTCKRMLSLLLFNWWCLIETTLLMDRTPKN